MRKGGRAMDSRRSPGIVSSSQLSDETLGRIFAHLDNPVDRRAVSQVCLQWKRVDSMTRQHVQVSNCYSIAPSALSRRFPNLKGVKMKGKSRAFEYDLLPPNWGGYAAPWVAEVARAYAHRFQSLWLRRMQVTDHDLLVLAEACHDSLLTLKLDKCSGFSAVGLSYITANCRLLKVLYLEESAVQESDCDGEWLRQLAVNNSNLEELNFQLTGLEDIDPADLEKLVENCKNLKILKVNEVDVVDVESAVSRSKSLLELGTGSCANIGNPQLGPPTIQLPKSIIGLSGLYEINDLGLPMIAPMLSRLKKLDLVYSFLSQEGYCQILQHCTSLEVLLARSGLGDAGLITVAKACKNLRRIRIEDNQGGEGFVTSEGIIPIGKSCVKLEYLVMYVTEISNSAMAAIGEYCTVLKDCRFVLLHTAAVVQDSPFDDGVRALLEGCRKLTRFAFYVRLGDLTDRGMQFIGQYGRRLKWLLLGCVGQSDLGLAYLASGCQSLERMELRDCPVTETGLATAAATMSSLKFMWMQGYDTTGSTGELLAKVRPFWTVEICPSRSMILAYSTMAEPRKDYPPEMTVIRGGMNQYYDNGRV